MGGTKCVLILKGGQMIVNVEKDIFFFDSSLFSVEFFSLTYSYFSTFTTDDTICSEAQLYHKAICYFTNIEIGPTVSRNNSH